MNMQTTAIGNGKKILFACVPADGHFNPLTGLAKHLQNIGYDVRWYLASKYEKKVQRLKIPFYPFTKAMDITADELETAFPERANIKSTVAKLNFDMEHFFIKRGPEYYADIKEIHESFPFDLLIADVLFMGSIYVKELMNIPVISAGVFPLMETSKDLAPNGLGIEPSTAYFGKLKQNLMRFMVKNILFRKPNKIMHRILKEHKIAHNNVFMFDMLYKNANYLIQSGTPGFEYKRSDLGNNIRFVGALLPYQTNNNNKIWFDERLNKYKKIVLITQGTVEKDVTKLIIPTLDAFKNTDTLVVCTTGGSKTNMLKENYTHDNIIIEDFIPFADIMPYADVYVTNGGYGGVMLAIEHKLPLVVAGIHEGKNEICARIGYFSYGINLKTETPNTIQLTKAVEEVLNNPIYKQNVEKLGEEFEQYNTTELCTNYVAELLQPRFIKSQVVNKVLQELV